MSYCNIHGNYDSSGDGCGECQRTEERNQQRLDDIYEEMAAAAGKRINPGDYTCPHCLYRSLRRGASLCPLCRAAPGPGYWEQIYEQERERRRQDEIKRSHEIEKTKEREAAWRREAPARAAKAAKEAAETSARQFGTLFAILWFAYFLPILIFTVGIHLAPSRGQGNGFGLLLIPGFNWFWFLGALLSRAFWKLLLGLLFFWSVVGVVLWQIIRKAPSRWVGPLVILAAVALLYSLIRLAP